MKKVFASFLAALILTLLSVGFIAASTAKAVVQKSDFKITQTADFSGAAVADCGIVRASERLEVRSNYFTAASRNVAVETRNIFQTVQLTNDFRFDFRPPSYQRINFNYGFANEQRLGKSRNVLPDFNVGTGFVKRE